VPVQAFKGAFGARRQTVARSNVTFSGTAIAAGGTIGTWTASPVTLVAATTFETTMVRVTTTSAHANSGLRSDHVFELMIGSAGSETTIATLIFGSAPAYSSYTLPILIPDGSRISGRTASGVASRSLSYSVDLFGGPTKDNAGLPREWIAYGMVITSGTSACGTTITAGSTNTWSAWTALTTSTTYAHDLWIPMCGAGTQTAITAVSYRTQFAIASTTDAATMVTNATGVHEGPWLTGSTTEQLGRFNVATHPWSIGPEHIIYAPRPAGSAVSARVMCSGTATANTTTCAVLAAVK
jgi:hypothetical protein